tara:strand:+ start:408 stop:524 length:117 start_codon:yes stop_codon:yes gene_type:complete
MKKWLEEDEFSANFIFQDGEERGYVKKHHDRFCVTEEI